MRGPPMGTPVRRVHGFLLIGLSAILSCALPDAAAAQEPAPTPTPTPGLPPLDYAGPAARISRGAPLTFTVRTPAPAGSVVVRVSGSDGTDDTGLLSGDEGSWLDEDAAPAGDGLQAWSAPASSLLRRRPGHYFWQAYLNGDAATGAAEPIGPVRELVVTLPAADRGHGTLVPRFGRRGAASFYLSSAGFPEAVSGARFQALAKQTGARWGLRALRWTSAVAGHRDGYNVAGFSSSVPQGVLGIQTDYTVGGRVVERDLALRADENWAAGPDYPTLDQIDLESVLLHELGHMAGNKHHRKRCSNSPMIEALGTGEWWHGARDHWFGDCSSSAHAASAGALQQRVVRVD
jgi:hypothetical protein